MEQFDYVVVGAGSAGCTVAARLSEDPGVSVAVLEAGRANIPAALRRDVEIPSHWRFLWNTDIDWGYESVPQVHCNGRCIPEPRGRLPGGTSKLYILMHIRGHRSDYDNWAYNGCPGWGYDEVLPYFQRQEDQEDDSNPMAGHGGAIRLQNAALHQPSPASQAFLDACVELGFPRTDDFNGPQMEGAGWHHLNIKDGKRHSTDIAYLNPALASRSNIKLIEGAQATRLRFEGRRCAGVDYLHDGQPATLAASAEVVVTAGAINSPKLLLLSGIGGAEQLWRLGIPVLVDLPGVGENFHNHVLAPVVYTPAQALPAPNQNISEVALFYHSGPGWPAPDIQMAFIPFDPTQVKDDNPAPVLIMLPGLVRPLARGWLRLRSADPLAKPLINPNYLGCEADLRRMVDAVRTARRLYATRALGAWVQTEVAPGADMPDERLSEYVRQAAESYHHQAGSCRMGLDALAVVDPQLRVHGVSGLRVADASVMPAVPSGNCHAGIVMIAEKAADLIKAARRG